MSDAASPLPRPGPKLGPLQLLIIIQLESSPKYGYEMLKAINEEFKGIWELKTGTLYPALKRLERQQIIQIKPEGDVDFYHLTTRGRDMLLQPFRAGNNSNEFSTRFLLAAVKWMSPNLRNKLAPHIQALLRNDGIMYKSLLKLLDGTMTREEKLSLLQALKKINEMRLLNIEEQLREMEGQ